MKPISNSTSLLFATYLLLLTATTTQAFSTTDPPYPSPDFEICEWISPLPEQDRLVQPNGTATNIVLFSDGTNFDDVISILFLAKSNRVRLLAVYLQGNAWASPGSSIRHIYNILHMMGPQFDHVPIFLGSYYAIEDELLASAKGDPVMLRYRIPVPFGSTGILLSDTLHGMGHFLPQSRNAYEIRKTPDEDALSIPAFFEYLSMFPESDTFTFLSIGTLTPLAKMFTQDYVSQTETILPRVDALFVMGGAVDVEGNLFSKPANLKAEFNIYNDPHAAQWAFKNLTERGIPVTLVPLDGTNDVPFQLRLLDELRFQPQTPEAQLAGRLMENLREVWFEPELFFETAFLWDPSAAIVSVFSDVVTEKQDRHIRIVLEQGPDGPEQGWTKPCTEHEVQEGICSLISVVSGLDGDKVTDALLNTLQEPRNSAALPLIKTNLPVAMRPLKSGQSSNS